jgi:hypothetical protein
VKRALVPALAVILVLAPIVPFAAVGPAAAAPAGMATIPDANVAEDVPDGETLALSASELEGGVVASDHADSLEVILTTADHAPTVMNGDTASVTGDGMAVVLRDDTESAGRKVAIDAEKLQEALGYRPQAIHGTHEDGSEWTASAEYVDGYLVFDVPHFSDNTVTFSGRVDLSLNSATSGTTATWELSDYDAASNVTINTTGVRNTKQASFSVSGATSGDTVPYQIGGNQPAENGDVTFTGVREETARSVSGSSTGQRSITIDGNREPTGPAGGEPKVSVDMGSSPLPDQVASAPYDTNAETITIPNDYPTTSATVKVTVENFGGYYSVYIDKNGNEIKHESEDSTFGDETSVYAYTTVSGGDTITVDSQGETILDYKVYDMSEPRTGDVTISTGSDSATITNGGSAPLDLSKSDGSISATKSGDAFSSYTIDYNDVSQTENPSVSIGGETVSHSEYLADGETVTKSASLSPGSGDAAVSGSGPVDLNASWTEVTTTIDPVVELNGQTTTIHSGKLADGETVTATIPKDQLQQGTNTLNVSLGDGSLSADAPEMRADIEASHEASDKISVGYSATTFEESYNVSHTYAAETSDAQVTIPFESSRVVGVKNVEYQIDGGGWERVGADNYRFNGTTVDVYVSDAVGGTVPAGSTVDVRATGRKMSVGNGAVTITDPTAPHEELDTQLRIDERSEDFHVNVGPTDDGDRVHYSYSDVFPTEDYVVIDSSGAQKMYLPNSKTGDTFRVKHLETRVVAEQGDVRIDVVEPGENPELDVSPGPGGDGDPVTVEYYNTESGVEYLLNSLKRSIVVDSDVAQSPAIFEDDDSEDTWQILHDSAMSSGGEGSGGAIGQFRERAGAAVGSVSAPSGVGGGQLLLLGLLGLGGVVAFRRFQPLGGRGVEVGERVVQQTGSGALSGLQGLLGYMSRVVSLVTSNRRASIAMGVIASIVAARVGLFQLPEGVGILIVVSGVPIASYLVLRRSDAVSQRVWLASTIVAVVLGLEFVAPGTIQTAIEQLTSEQVAPLLILVAAGGGYLWYRARQSDRPVFNVVTRRD